MVKLESYWHSNREWFHFNVQGLVLNDDAPEEAKRSYQRYLNQLADIDKRTKRYLIIPKGQADIDSLKRSEDPNWEDESFETDLLITFGRKEIIEMVKSMNVHETRILSDLVKLVRFQ